MGIESSGESSAAEIAPQLARQMPMSCHIRVRIMMQHTFDDLPDTEWNAERDIVLSLRRFV